jgi:hypothetical protein
MQQVATQLAVTAGVATVIRFGTRLAVGPVFRRFYHPIVDDYPTVKSAYPALALEIGQLGELQQEARFRRIMSTLKGIVELDEEKRRGNEFKLARLIAQLNQDMKVIVERTESWRSDRLFNEQRIAQQDTCPTVERQVENILFNYIAECSGK